MLHLPLQIRQHHFYRLNLNLNFIAEKAICNKLDGKSSISTSKYGTPKITLASMHIRVPCKRNRQTWIF